MTRLQAASIHFGISAAIAALVVGLMMFIWYPGPLFTAMGGHTLVMILIAVDVVLGPLITLVIFNPRKARHLIRFDLAVIGFVQAAALAYGVFIVSQVRPAFMVFTVDRFDLVAVIDLEPEALAMGSRPEYREIPWGGPRVVGANPPQDASTQMEIIMSAAAGGRDVQHFPRFYAPYESLAATAATKAKPVERLRKAHPESAKALDATLARLGRTLEDTRYLPLKARAHDYSVLVDAKSGAILGYVEINPW